VARGQDDSENLPRILSEEKARPRRVFIEYLLQHIEEVLRSSQRYDDVLGDANVFETGFETGSDCSITLGELLTFGRELLLTSELPLGVDSELMAVQFESHATQRTTIVPQALLMNSKIGELYVAMPRKIEGVLVQELRHLWDIRCVQNKLDGRLSRRSMEGRGAHSEVKYYQAATKVFGAASPLIQYGIDSLDSAPFENRFLRYVAAVRSQDIRMVGALDEITHVIASWRSEQALGRTDANQNAINRFDDLITRFSWDLWEAEREEGRTELERLKSNQTKVEDVVASVPVLAMLASAKTYVTDFLPWIMRLSQAQLLRPLFFQDVTFLDRWTEWSVSKPSNLFLDARDFVVTRYSELASPSLDWRIGADVDPSRMVEWMTQRGFSVSDLTEPTFSSCD